MDFNKDYYAILEVEKTASKEEIKAAYRRLVKLHHPDRNPDDEKAEDRIKEVNEAYNLLFNDLTRHEYDEYCKEKEEEKKRVAQEQQEEQSAGIDDKNKHTYVRTHTVHREKRTYLKGIITVKFWGELLEEGQQTFEREVDYRIHPTDVIVRISHTDIHPLERAPTEYQHSYKESDLFTTPLKQPVNCVIQTKEEEEHYALELKDIRVNNPTITNVTKHEGESFGTLTGELYAFVNEFIKEEYELLQTECFGESGNVEFKEEDGQFFMRKELYNLDCTTNWGPWQPLGSSSFGKSTGSSATTSRPRRNYSYPDVTPKKPGTAEMTEPAGCFKFWWALPLLIFALAFPVLGAGIGIIAGLWAFFALLFFLFARLRLLMGLLGLIFLAAVFVSFMRTVRQPITVPHDTAKYDSLSTTTQTVVKRKEPVTSSPTGDTTQYVEVTQDTLISHFIRWRDYDSVSYEATLSVLTSELQSSTIAHQQLRHYPISGWQQVYGYLEREDSAKLRNIYTVFDSIRLTNNLSEKSFAHMVVSCIQSIPYYLVLDHTCNPSHYTDDEYVFNYLQECNRDCCIGNVAYGIASPVEFMGSLKGDCDTRALLIYSVLKRFGYNVALLTSDYYKHAVIGVAFHGVELNGLSMNIRNKNYYLWETTSAGIRPGFVSPAMQNLDFWNVSLLNEID